LKKREGNEEFEDIDLSGNLRILVVVGCWVLGAEETQVGEVLLRQIGAIRNEEIYLQTM